MLLALVWGTSCCITGPQFWQAWWLSQERYPSAVLGQAAHQPATLKFLASTSCLSRCTLQQQCPRACGCPGAGGSGR
jgi:hypothetical protein